jgi:hypothetical protein
MSHARECSQDTRVDATSTSASPEIRPIIRAGPPLQVHARRIGALHGSLRSRRASTGWHIAALREARRAVPPSDPDGRALSRFQEVALARAHGRLGRECARAIRWDNVSERHVPAHDAPHDALLDTRTLPTRARASAHLSRPESSSMTRAPAAREARRRSAPHLRAKLKRSSRRSICRTTGIRVRTSGLASVGSSERSANVTIGSRPASNDRPYSSERGGKWGTHRRDRVIPRRLGESHSTCDRLSQKRSEPSGIWPRSASTLSVEWRRVDGQGKLAPRGAWHRRDRARHSSGAPSGDERGGDVGPRHESFRARRRRSRVSRVGDRF